MNTDAELAAANALVELNLQAKKRNPTTLIALHRIPGTADSLYTIFNSRSGDRYLSAHELCRILGMNRTTIYYWFRVSGASDRQVKHKKISASARTIFGGRSTYAFYSVRDVVLTLARISGSRQSRDEDRHRRLVRLLEYLKTLI